MDLDSFDINTGNYDPSTLNEKPRRAERKAAPVQTPQPEPRKLEEDDDPSESRIAGLKNIFKDGRLGIFAGIILIGFGLYMLLSAISYFHAGADDQSLVDNNTIVELSKNPAEVSNLGGPFGAYISQAFLSNGLGIGTFVLIFYVLAVGLTLVKVHKFKFWPLTFKSLFSAVAVSIIVGFLTYGNVSHMFWGGEHGYYINSLLMSYTGFWGDLAINIILLAALILIFLGYIKVCISFVARIINSHRQRLKESHQRALEKAEKEREQQIEEPQEVVNEQPEEPTQDPIVIPADEPETESDIIIDDTPAVEIDTPEIEPKAEPEVELIIDKPEIETADTIKNDAYDPTADLSRYRFPSLELLKVRSSNGSNVDIEEQEENKERITHALRTYDVEIESIKATVGPTITLYEIVPAAGVRIAKIKRLGDDMAMSLAAQGIRIIAPIPGRGTIGMEVPNRDPQIVNFRDILASKAYQESKAELPMAMGTTISNEVFVADLCKMPHLLVAGATGMGKSVGLNTIIASLLYKKHPAELKFVLIDPKMVEFSLYSALEHHYLAKLPEEESGIITDYEKVIATLNSLCVEMDNRFKMLKDAGVRDIVDYNKRFTARRLNPEKGHKYLPYLVVIVDEFADLIATAGREIETPVARIAQKGRAAGMHMILATQRPSVNVITGIIKANFPGRIAFRVTQSVDSRTILDRPGAEQLIGRGDMLFSRNGIIDRVQCAFIDTDEVEAICESISDQIGYPTAYELPDYIPTSASGGGGGSMGNVTDRDPLFYEAGRAIIESGTGSTSFLQRKYNIGYPRAGKIMDQLEIAGVVSASQGGKPRQVLMDIVTFETAVQ